MQETAGCSTKYLRWKGGAFFKEKVSKGYMVLRELKKNEKRLDTNAVNKWSRDVKKEAGFRCLRCGSKKNIESHHVVPKACQTLRLDKKNGVCLCIKCHVPFAHDHPEEFKTWIISIRGQEWWDYLMAKKLKFAKDLNEAWIDTTQQEASAVLQTKDS